MSRLDWIGFLASNRDKMVLKNGLNFFELIVVHLVCVFGNLYKTCSHQGTLVTKRPFLTINEYAIFFFLQFLSKFIISFGCYAIFIFGFVQIIFMWDSPLFS